MNSSRYIPFTLGAPALIWQMLFLYCPLLLIVGTSFISVSATGLTLTLQKFITFFQPTYLYVIFSSLLLGFSNAFLCLLIAYPLAYFMASSRKHCKNLLLFLLIIPFWTNFLLHVYAWFFVLEKEGFINHLLQSLQIISTPIAFMNTLFATMVMMVYYYLPFMVLPIYFALDKFDVRLIEASLDLGATKGETFRRIVAPLSMSGVRAGFFLVYIPSFGEFVIPELMGGDKLVFVGSIISRYILGDETGSLGAAFAVFACSFLLISCFLFHLLLQRVTYALQKP